MEFILICSGVWNMIFAFAEWSLEAKNRLLKLLCVINGVILFFAGVVSVFFPLNEKSISLSFFSSLLLLGALFYSKFNIEKNTISFFACFSAVILVVCAIGMILFADSIDDSVYACVTLTGSVMILSTPFEKPYEKAKKR